jgi:hypothetical protein
MDNYVNFITDKINPSVINAYLDGPGTPDDFVGSDSSTMDYTKFGYTAAVYRQMLRSGKASADVVDVVRMIANFTDEDGNPNYKLRSSTGYSIAEMMVYDGRNDVFFAPSDIASVVGGDFMGFFAEAAVMPASDGVGNALHMMVEFKQQKAISEMPPELFRSESTSETATKVMSPYMYALKRAADSGMESERVSVYTLIRDGLTGGYNDKFGPNNMSITEVNVYNEIAKFLITTSSEGIKSSIELMVGSIPGTSPGAAPMVAATVKAEGLSANSISFDIGIYEGMISDEKDMGYSPLFFYANRFKSSCDIDVLESLATKFSIFTITTENGSTDGYNVAGILGASLSVSDSGTWNNPELAGWLSGKLGEGVSGLSKYKAFVAIGNARDCSGGTSNNAYGAVTNVLRAINSYHQSYNRSKTEDSPDFDPTSLLSGALPSVFDKSFYEEWMIEFGQEVD